MSALSSDRSNRRLNPSAIGRVKNEQRDAHDEAAPRLLYALMYAITVKLLERRLSFAQSLLMSGIASAITIVLLLIYNLARPLLGEDGGFDKIVGFALLCLFGAIITRLAHNYGVEKRGWLGLGARANI